MAKPKKSKLKGQQTGKGKPKNVARFSSISTDSNKSMVSTSSSSHFSLITPLDSYDTVAFAPSVATMKARHVSVSTENENLHSKPVQMFNLELQSSKSPIRYKIYEIKQRPIEMEKELEPIKEVYSSSEAEEEEVEEEQSAPEDCVDDYFQSDGEKSDISSKLESVNSGISDHNIRVRFNVLKEIQTVPDWDELSADTSIAASIEDSDMGGFRAPLDSISTISSVEEMSLQLESYLNYDDHDSKEEPKSSETHSKAHSPMVSELESDEEDDWNVKQPQVKMASIPSLREVQLQDSMLTFDSLEMVRYRPSQTHQSYLEGFFEELVDKVIQLIETGKNNLKNRLDKMKLGERLCAEVEDYDNEKFINDYLVDRMTGFHLRRSKFSLISPVSDIVILKRYQRRFERAIIELDYWLNREQESERIYSTERERLLKELEEKQSQDEEDVKRVEDLIKETLLQHTEVRKRLDLVMDNVFRLMRRKRNEISDSRLDLILKQHTYSYIKQKFDETETISEGLKLTTYNSVKINVDCLDRDLSFKTAELERLYTLFLQKIHTISHLKCRRKLLSRTFYVAKDELTELRKKHLKLRTKIYKIHMRHNKVLAQIKKVRRKGGLMHYPLLLRDYDKTNQILTNKRKRVRLLGAHHDNLLQKVEEVEREINRSLSVFSQVSYK